MTERSAVKNGIVSILLHITQAISGLILPRLFIVAYGSSVNGLTSSVMQFISYMSLVEAGIGAAGTLALYKPLIIGDRDKISAVVSSAKEFYLKSGMIYALLCGLMVFFYPSAVKSEIQSIAFIRMMIAVLCINGLVDYFYLGKYRILLSADQKNYVIAAFQILCTILNTIISAVLIKVGAGALLVKAVAAAVYIAKSLAVGVYVKRNYPYLNLKAAPDRSAFGQRYSALLHEIAGMVTFNTDIILLTLMGGAGALTSVSVYATYNLVAYGVSGMMTSLPNALAPSFGRLMTEGDRERLKNAFDAYEKILFILVCCAYSCMAVMIMPFMRLYCAEFTDRAIYISVAYMVMFIISGLLLTLRMPAVTMISAAGHYRLTQKYAVTEAVINLAVSVTLVKPFGIFGVLAGTEICFLFRMAQSMIYVSKKVLPEHTLTTTLKRMAVNLLTAAAASVAGVLLIPREISSFVGWCVWALSYGICEAALQIAVNLLLGKKSMHRVLDTILRLVKER